MAKTAAINPFAAATKKAPAEKKALSNVLLPADYVGPDGKVIATKKQLIDAVNNYAKGSTQKKEGESMMTTTRPTILQFVRKAFAMNWLTSSKRPGSPKLVTQDDGKGTFVSVSFQDRERKLDEHEFSRLAALIGQKEAEKFTVKRHEFLINPDTLDNADGTPNVVDVKGKDGKTVQMSVMDAMVEALQEKFSPSPDVLGALFHAVDKFHTKKGLLDMGVQLVAPDKSPASAVRLAQFLEMFVCAIKPAGDGEDCDD